MKLFQDRKGLSPIFASLLILAIITTLFIPVFIWSTGITSQTKNFWDIMSGTATERIVIEMVSLDKTKTSCEIYVRNIGKTAIKVENVFIILDDTTTRVFDKGMANFKTYIWDPVSSQFVLRNDAYVPQGELIKVVLTFDPLPNSSVYTFKVYTPNGVGDFYQIKG